MGNVQKGQVEARRIGFFFCKLVLDLDMKESICAGILYNYISNWNLFMQFADKENLTLLKITDKK